MIVAERIGRKSDLPTTIFGEEHGCRQPGRWDFRVEPRAGVSAVLAGRFNRGVFEVTREET